MIQSCNERVDGLVEALLEGIGESGAIGRPIADQAKKGQQTAQVETVGGGRRRGRSAAATEARTASALGRSADVRRSSDGARVGLDGSGTTELGSAREVRSATVESVNPVPLNDRSSVPVSRSGFRGTTDAGVEQVHDQIVDAEVGLGGRRGGDRAQRAAARNAPAVVDTPTTAQPRSLALRERVFRFACRPATFQPLLEPNALPAFSAPPTQVTRRVWNTEPVRGIYRKLLRFGPVQRYAPPVRRR